MNARTLISLVLLAGVMVIDGYDLNSMALAIPHVSAELRIAAPDFWLPQSAVLLGLGAGALLIAPIGDRVGRKWLIVGGSLAIFAATLITAISTSVLGFTIWRFLTGAALGACLANVSALSSEIAPEGKRSTVMALVSAGIAIGAMGAGFTAPELVGFGGWRALFVLPAAVALLLAFGLALSLDNGLPPGDGEARPGARVPLAELFRPPLALALALFAAAYMVNAIALYMLVSWTPVVLPEAGFSIDLAARVQGLMQGMGLPVSIALAILIDKWKPGLTLGLAYLVAGLGFLAIWATPAHPLSWTLLLLVAGGSVAGIHGALMATTPRLFPSRVLSSAIGAAVAISRIGAIAAPPIGAWLIAHGVTPGAYYLSLVMPVALCGILVLQLPRVMAAGARSSPG
jgi:AAHS family 4-hydroxybenzoate transporter-like MFS transporter